MVKTRYILFGLWLCVCSSLVWAGNSALPTTLIIASSAENAPVIKLLLDAYQKKTRKFTVRVFNDLGSKGSILGVNENRIDLAVVSRPLTPEEEIFDLKVVPYAKSNLVFVVHPDVKVADRNLASENIIQIIDGTKNQWDDGTPIHVALLSSGTAATALLKEHIPELKDPIDAALKKRNWRVEYCELKATRALEKTKGSIGWIDQSFLISTHSPLQVMKFNGVEPNLENLTLGQYPLVRQLNFVYKTPLDPKLEKFINFVKSKAGAEILRDNGELPN